MLKTGANQDQTYTEYAGCAVAAGIPGIFGTAHGRLRPEVGNGSAPYFGHFYM